MSASLTKKRNFVKFSIVVRGDHFSYHALDYMLIQDPTSNLQSIINHQKTDSQEFTSKGTHTKLLSHFVETRKNISNG